MPYLVLAARYAICRLPIVFGFHAVLLGTQDTKLYNIQLYNIYSYITPSADYRSYSDSTPYYFELKIQNFSRRYIAIIVIYSDSTPCYLELKIQNFLRRSSMKMIIIMGVEMILQKCVFKKPSMWNQAVVARAKQVCSNQLKAM